MPLLYYWRGDNFYRDLDMGAGYHLNQANPLLHQIEIGDSLWAFTRRRDGTYVLAAELIIKAKTINPPSFRYGKYRVGVDINYSRYFQIQNQPSVGSVIRSLSCKSNARILGMSFQGLSAVKLISQKDAEILKMLAKELSLEQRARILSEDKLEAMLLLGNIEAVKNLGENPNHRDNLGLRTAYELNRPLVYLYGFEKGKYLPTYPVYIVGDDPDRLTFRVAVDDALPEVEYSQTGLTHQIAEVSGARHAYLTATVKIRLHQRAFREKVLDAYRSQCAFCRPRHRELLDAAHIIPDNLPESRPTIDNGISLCKLHHAAYDNFILGVTPDYVIHVREDVLEEEDGPVLQHGLKGLHNTKLILPSARHNYPSREALEWRYSRFTRVT
jgi:putative restriction endonuclease